MKKTLAWSWTPFPFHLAPHHSPSLLLAGCPTCLCGHLLPKPQARERERERECGGGKREKGLSKELDHS